MKIDLHTHSTYSDGTLAPELLVEAASKVGITHLALSDHDSTEGLSRARTKAAQLNITLIPAVEINTETNPIHILGYFVDENDSNFLNTLKKNRDSREHRMNLMLEKLKGLGINISKEELLNGNKDTALGRPHVADNLIKKGIVKSRAEAFDRYLGKGCPAFVPHKDTTPEDAIQTILAGKGVPVLAHPGFGVQEETIRLLTEKGLQGLEAYYLKHSPDQIKKFLEIAKRYHLVATGGSDYHGPGSGHEALGQANVPLNTVEEILKRKEKLF